MLNTIEYFPREIEVGEEYDLEVLLPDDLGGVIGDDPGEVTQGSTSLWDEEENCEKVVLFNFLDIEKINELWRNYLETDDREEAKSIRDEIGSLRVKVIDIYLGMY